MILQEKADSANMLGIYFHVPFGATTCGFRSYSQKAPRRRDVDSYLEGIKSELALCDICNGVDTVLWGGGTPGLLRASDLQRLGNALLEKLPHPPTEWTVELAPSTVKRDKLEVLLELGVNRISLGVQSFQTKWLEALGCRHSSAQVDRAINTIRSVGFHNLNLDMMFSIPGQGIEDWMCDLHEAIKRQPEHISTYCLTFEEDSALYARLLNGGVKKNADSVEAEIYLKTWDALEDAGYAQYEISNFAKPGFSCRHNLNTWNMNDWLGLGPSAASQYKERRYSNVHSISEWLAGLSEGKPRLIDMVTLTSQTLACDSLIFGLRMNAGFDVGRLCQKFPKIPFDDLEPLWNQWEADGLLEKAGNAKWRPTVRGLLIADRLGIAVLEAFDAMNSQHNRPTSSRPVIVPQ